MAYPTSLDNLATNYLGTDQADVVDHAGMHNDVNEAVNAVEAELGTTPSGSEATVAARLDAIEAGTRLASGAVTAEKIGALTTKGDLLGRDASGAARLPVGTDGQVLVASSAAASGLLWTSGGVQARTTSGSITLLDTVVTADTTSGAVTLTLPAASGCTGKAIRILKAAGANTLTVQRAGADTIVPSSGTRTSVAFPAGATFGEMVLVSTGSAWHVASGQASDESAGRRIWKWSQSLAAASTTASVGFQLVHMDTGLRDLSAETLSNGWSVYGGEFRLERVGRTVALTIYLSRTGTSSDAVYTFPSGFRPAHTIPLLGRSDTTDDIVVANVTSAGVLSVTRAWVTGTYIYLAGMWPTLDASPSSLPGTASLAIPTT